MRYTLSVGADAEGVTMLRSTKMPSKYTSLARLQEIAANNYCGRDGQDYEASYVDMLIAEKADKLSDELIEDYYDEQNAYAEHLAELEAEYFVDMDETLLATSSADTTDGQLPAGAFADWTALVAERAAAVVAAVFHKVPRKLKNLLHTRYTSVTPSFVGNDAEHQGDVPMKNTLSPSHTISLAHAFLITTSVAARRELAIELNNIGDRDALNSIAEYDYFFEKLIQALPEQYADMGYSATVGV